jgi:hypothetical protein
MASPDDPRLPSAAASSSAAAASDGLAGSPDPDDSALAGPSLEQYDDDDDDVASAAAGAAEEFPAPPLLSPPPRSPRSLASAEAAATLSTYGAEPLETGRLRLATIQPGRAPAPLVLTLSTHKVVSQPHYEALSYAGDPPSSRRRAVQLDGRAWLVAPTLLAALLHLRRSRQPRTLWVDALCVNPHSAVERGFQAAQAAAVLRGAARVLAWLGPGTVENAAALDAITQIVKSPRAHWYATGHRDEDRIDRRDPSIGKADWFRGMRDVVASPWWSRLSTLADAVLARDLVFLLGSRALPLESLFRACESWAYHTAKKRCCTLMLADLRAGMGNVTRLELRRAKWRQAKRVDMDLVRRQVALVEAKPAPGPRERNKHMSLVANRAHAERYEFLRDAHDTLMKRYADFLASSPDEGAAKAPPADGEDRRALEREFSKVRDRLRGCALDLLCERDAQRRALFAAASPQDEARLEQREAAVWADLLALMDECRARSCVDPRDRVYALCALRSHLFQAAPLVDYVFPAHKVWEDLQLEMMQRSRSLNVLSLLGPRSVERDVSWTVDWAAPAAVEPNAANAALLKERLEYAARFAAHGGEPSRVNFVSPRAVALGGFALGRVRKVGLSHLVADAEMAWFKYREWWEALELDRLPMPTDVAGRPLEEVLCELIMGCSSMRPAGVVRNARAFQEQLLANIRAYRTRRNNAAKGEPDPQQPGQQSWLKRSATLRRAGSKRDPQGPAPAPAPAPAAVAPMSPSPVPAPTSADLVAHAMRATINRQLVVSDTGHVALAPIGVQRGDEICVLYGGRSPLVLRQAGRDPDGYGDRALYRIVGDAYVHGVMEGEAVRRLRDAGEGLPDTELLII